MIVGFTGTAQGMTERQKSSLRQLFLWLMPSALRHGDCVGADAEAHDIYLTCSVLASEDSILIHPGYSLKNPQDESKAAFRQGVMQHSALPYLQRNKWIAGCVAGFNTDLLIAAPHSMKEVLRSGTWATVRYARRCGTPTIILLP